MTASSAHDPEPAESGSPRRGRGLWRIGTPVVVLLSGALFAVSGTNSEGTDLRPGRYTDLATLTENESDAYQELQAEEAGLREEVDALAADVEDAQVRRVQRRAERLMAPAGLGEVSGPGVTVVLSDAPQGTIEDALEDPESRLELLVVHQQDIQAVVNAMWAGGAGAVTIQGQRVVTTTGIKCSGSAVQLQGVPYPQPYTIQAVGDPVDLLTALDGNGDVSRYRSDAERPEIGVGFEMQVEDDVDAPAYDGLLDVSSARPQD